jgi:hypothetical protein
MMWMLQYVKGGDNLVDIVVDGRLILKWPLRHGMAVLSAVRPT